MAKKTFKAGGLQELGTTISNLIGADYKKLDKMLGEGSKFTAEDIMMRRFRIVAEPIIDDIERFMSEHEQTGETWSSFNRGVLVGNIRSGWIELYMGFDKTKGGLPAVILERGDTGSPMRMPNKAYYFMYYAERNNPVDERMIERLNADLEDIKRELGM